MAYAADTHLHAHFVIGAHLAYLLADGGEPVAVFTGGSLIVGAAARTDLAHPDRTEELTRAQYASLHRPATLRDDVAVWLTHGAGSFCSAPDEDTFVTQLSAGLGTCPAYSRRPGGVNRRGPAPLPADVALAPLTVEQVLTLRATRAEVVDVRTLAGYAAGHIPGAPANTLRPVSATWLRWLVPDPATPLGFVRDADQNPEEIVRQAHKIGYETVDGESAGGMAARAAAGQPVATVPPFEAGQVDPARVLDVRQEHEYAGGHLPGPRHVELGALPAADLPGLPVVTMCGHGECAASATSMLERAGHRQLAVVVGDPDDGAGSSGRALTVEP